MSNSNIGHRQPEKKQANHRYAPGDIIDYEGVKLRFYGFQTDTVAWRCHVCPRAGRVYLFRPTSIANAIARSGAKRKPGYQVVGDEKRVTALGFLVEPSAFEEIITVDIEDMLPKYNFDPRRGQAALGREAEKLVAELLAEGRVSLPVDGWKTKFVTDKREQYTGADLIAEPAQPLRIQVKCDEPGGEKRVVPFPGQRNALGTLYLQYAERNPTGAH